MEVNTMAQDADSIITFDHVTKQFPPAKPHGAPRVAVDDVSFSVKRGEIFGVIGYSGAGKSTLVRLINELERPTGGTVTVLGQDVTKLSESKMRPIRQKIGMVFQQFNLFASKTVAGNIEYPLKQDRWREDYRKARIKELLEFVGLSQYAHAYPAQLSGGQKQRVGIARALATRPDILLADEATSALDPQTTSEVLELLKRTNARFGVTIVLITHQMDVITRIADRVLVMSGGAAVESGDLYRVFAQPQQDITREFVSTAINTIPSKADVERLRAMNQGRLVTVIMREPAPEFDITPSGQRISAMLTHRNITNSILMGGVQEVAGRGLGAFTYEFYGADGNLDTYIKQLRMANGIVDFGTAQDPVDYAEAVRTYYGYEAKRLEKARSEGWNIDYDKYTAAGSGPGRF